MECQQRWRRNVLLSWTLDALGLLTVVNYVFAPLGQMVVARNERTKKLKLNYRFSGVLVLAMVVIFNNQEDILQRAMAGYSRHGSNRSRSIFCFFHPTFTVSFCFYNVIVIIPGTSLSDDIG